MVGMMNIFEVREKVENGRFKGMFIVLPGHPAP